ncbi:MAG: hypothetical protein AAF487_13555 [Bacteroidota bacterium]
MFFVFVLIFLSSCAARSLDENSEEIATPQNKEFNAYWYTGKAEVNVYNLEQARYGEIHKGKAIRIFVTEDFLVDKQVKKESMTQDESTSVMKMNFIKKFPTGIYDYSMMSSVFTPIDIAKYRKTLKTTTSSQEWCGHTFSQLNLQGNKYEFTGHSYFENEGEQNFSLDYAFLEDEIWNRMRLNPMGLPQGKLKLIPSSMNARLKHYDLKAEDATAGLTLKVDEDQQEFFVYTIKYENGRELLIQAHSQFPHRITYWEDSYISGFGPNRKKLTTKASLDKSVKEAYWGQNANRFQSMRKDLGLD